MQNNNSASPTVFDSKLGDLRAECYSDSIVLKWRPLTELDSDEDPLFYQVFYRDTSDPGNNWIPVPAEEPGATTLTNLCPETVYAVFVIAFNESGRVGSFPGDDEYLLTRTTIAPDTETPTVSSKVLSATRTGDSVTLKWKAAKDDITEDSFIRYKVYRTELGAWQEPKMVKGVKSYTFIDLTPATKYRFRVEALDEADNVLPYDEIEVETEDSVPPTAESAELNATSSGNDNVTIHWTPATDNATPENEILYRVSRAVNGKWEIPIEAKNIAAYTFSDLLPVAKYLFRVQAFDAAGKEFRYDDFEWITVDDVKPEAPDTGVKLTIKDNKVTVSWAAAKDNVTAAKKIVYRVYRTENGAWQPPVEVREATSYDFTNLEYAKSYKFKVEAADEAGNVLKYKEELGYVKDTVIPKAGSTTLDLVCDKNDVTVSWAPATDNVTVNAKIRYKVYWWEDVMEKTPKDVSGAGPCKFSGLTYGKTYRFQVKAWDEAENVLVYDSKSIKVMDKEKPTASNTDLMLETDDNKVTVKWMAATDNATAKASILYKVYCKVDGVEQAPKDVRGATSYQFTNLTYKKTYTFRVEARDEADNVLNYGSKSVTIADTKLPQIGNPVLSLTLVDNSVTVKWAAASDNYTIASKIRYKVNCYTDAGVLYSSKSVTGNTSETITNLVYGKTYKFKVTAFDEADNSINYTEQTKKVVDTKSPTLSNTALTLEAKNNTITVKWTAASDNATAASKIRYMVSRTENGVWQAEKQVTGTTSYAFPGLTYDKNYTFRVRAIDEAGNAISYLSKAMTLRDTDKPTISQSSLTLTPARDSIQVQWTKASDNATATDKIRYKVYRTQAGVWQSPVTVTGSNSYKFTGLNPSTTYNFKVEALDESGNSQLYLQRAATTLEGTAPTVSSRSLGVSDLLDDRFTISWKMASDNVTPTNKIQYKVWLRESGSWRLVREATGISSYTFTGLKANTEYGYYVCAFDEAGNCLQYPADGRCNLLTTQRARVHALSFSIEQGASVLKYTNTVYFAIEYEYYGRNSDGSIAGFGNGAWEYKWSNNKDTSSQITLPPNCYFKDHKVYIRLRSRRGATKGLSDWKFCNGGYVDVGNGSLKFKLTGSYYSYTVNLGGTAAQGYAQFK